MLKHLRNNFLYIILRKNKGGSYCKKVLGSFKIFSYLQGGGGAVSNWILKWSFNYTWQCHDESKLFKFCHRNILMWRRGGGRRSALFLLWHTDSIYSVPPVHGGGVCNAGLVWTLISNRKPQFSSLSWKRKFNAA